MIPPPPMMEISAMEHQGEQEQWTEDDMGSISDRGGGEDSAWSHTYRGGSRQRRGGRTIYLPQSHEDFSASNDGDNDSTYNTFYGNDPPVSHQSHHHHHLNETNSYPYSSSPAMTGSFYYGSQYEHYNRQGQWRRLFRGLLTYQNILQCMVLVVFALMVYDSHSRVSEHRQKLEEYDEERAHILEQMMWIDKAAKKVHKKYAQKAIWDSISDEKLRHENHTELLEEAEGLRDAMKKMQLRIQLNARERIQQRFGDSPVVVTLSLDREGQERLEIALTDDTPHTVSTLLEQIDKQMWDTIELQRIDVGQIVQLSTDLPATNPILEFIESSKSCRDEGSVVLRQLEASTMDLNVAVLRVHMTSDVPKNEEDVCIGRVVKGLQYLQAMNSIPVIHEEE